MHLTREPFFTDRKHAADVLSVRLLPYVDDHSLIVSTSRGGVKLAYYISAAFNVPLELALCSDLRLPGQTKTFGSVCVNEIRTHDVPRDLPQDYIAYQIRILEDKQHRQYDEAYGALPLPRFKGKTVLLTDDWVYSSDELISSIHFIRKQHPEKIVVAIPAISAHAVNTIRKEVDALVFLRSMEEDTHPLDVYGSFPTIKMDEVKRCIRRSRMVHSRA
jgi:predicted phosphoribosyltransferase